MFKKARPFFLHVITPLHAGSGNDLGIVDLPIQREKHTDYPKIESSSLKGGLREAFEEQRDKIIVGDKEVNEKNKQNTINLVFGPENTGAEGHAGAIGFTDGRTLLFPVKSMKGVFAWITCPNVLGVFERELKLCGIDTTFLNGIQKNTVSDDEYLLVNEKNIILEEYTFEVSKNDKTETLALWLSKKIGIEDINKKLVILSDDDFRDFINLSTEVITRIKIDPDTGTVAKGALFTEEFLPPETVIYSLVLSSKIFKEKKDDKGIFNQNSKEEDLIMEYFIKSLPEVIQLGGDATLGKGIIRTKVMEVQNG